MQSSRTGFTLLELLVAAGIFMFGFVAAYTMFLTGVRHRQMADSITRTSLAATSIIAELRMRAGREASILTNVAPIPAHPSYYVGNGFAYDGRESDAEGFIRYADQPGIWYRVTQCTDLARGDDEKTVAIKMRLVIVYMPIDSSVLATQPGGNLDRLSLAYLHKRLRIDTSMDMDQTATILVERQVGQVYDTVIHRHPSWMP